MTDIVVAIVAAFAFGFALMLYLGERERHRATKEILRDMEMSRDRWRDLARDMAARRGPRNAGSYIN